MGAFGGGVANVLIAPAALPHARLFVLEMFLRTMPFGLGTFNMTPEVVVFSASPCAACYAAVEQNVVSDSAGPRPAEMA